MMSLKKHFIYRLMFNSLYGLLRAELRIDFKFYFGVQFIVLSRVDLLVDFQIRFRTQLR